MTKDEYAKIVGKRELNSVIQNLETEIQNMYDLIGDLEKGKISINTISETSSDFIEEESKEVEQAKETGGELYGEKKFIPEKIRVGSDIRLVGNGFEPKEELKLYLDNTILKIFILMGTVMGFIASIIGVVFGMLIQAIFFEYS